MNTRKELFAVLTFGWRIGNLCPSTNSIRWKPSWSASRGETGDIGQGDFHGNPVGECLGEFSVKHLNPSFFGRIPDSPDIVVKGFLRRAKIIRPGGVNRSRPEKGEIFP